jgi:hypothetical protein
MEAAPPPDHGGVMRKINVLAAIATLVVATTAPAASAQCSDPTKHLRSGLWKQWVFWTLPGPTASAAVQRVIAEVNQARAAAALPLLVFDPQEPLVVGLIEENNPRGPDGANLTGRLPNQEIFFATFAEVETGGEVVLFLTDPLRSNAELTAKGIPGAPAVFERSMKFALEGTDGGTSTRWIASNTGDQVKFDAEYSSAAITTRGRYPGASSYLNCNLGHSLDVVYRSVPTQTFAFLERNQASYLFDLARTDVQVSLKVKHHDSDISAMFNDPQNVPYLLIELDRVVRIERQ